MSVSDRNVALLRAACRREAVLLGPCGGPERLRWLVRRIADDDREALCELFDRCSGLVARRLRRQVSDPHRAGGVLAGAFVEVWRLAAHHVDPGTDVVAWVEEIVQRRVADSRPAALWAAVAAWPGVGSLGALWAQDVEIELAELLRRRVPACA
ncbi:hypothetical protein [Paractinoplanes rishiriensis]|uniref:hypothetical protein n=1 Tax=Paractinoplanes rishiriensis TaxID=1050105 RepID=UPI001941EC6A|nr:hypothetical protein [Actinoplanes rishiriensis]